MPKHAKNTKHTVVETMLFKSYVAVIENSLSTKMFKNFFCKVNSRQVEVLRDGKLSCAFYVSSVLKMFSLIENIQITVHRTIDDMERSGWRKIKNPRKGCVVFWGEKPADPNRLKKDGQTYAPVTRHLGFYLGGGNAISTGGDETHTPSIHKYKYRKVEALYWHPKLD